MLSQLDGQAERRLLRWIAKENTTSWLGKPQEITQVRDMQKLRGKVDVWPAN